MFKLATKFRPDESAFEIAAAAGYRAAEFWLNADLLMGWQEVAEQAAAYPLGYALHFPNKGKLTRQHLEHTVDLYRQLDCRALVIHQPMFDRFGAALLDIDCEICLAVENHRLTRQGLSAWAVPPGRGRPSGRPQYIRVSGQARGDD